MTDSVAASEFITVAKVGDIPDGEGRAFAVNGRMVAIFNEEGKYSAIDDFCPHMGASLAGGYLEGGIVTCPWHGWRFDGRNGACLEGGQSATRAYPVKVRDDRVYVQIDDASSEALASAPSDSQAAANSAGSEPSGGG